MKSIQDFIDFYEAIPEEKWCTEAYQKDEGRCCALGHIRVKNNCYEHTPEEDLLRELAIHAGYKCIAYINDGKEEHFPQETPKQRVLAFLRSLL